MRFIRIRRGDGSERHYAKSLQAQMQCLKADLGSVCITVSDAIRLHDGDAEGAAVVRGPFLSSNRKLARLHDRTGRLFILTCGTVCNSVGHAKITNLMFAEMRTSRKRSSACRVWPARFFCVFVVMVSGFHDLERLLHIAAARGKLSRIWGKERSEGKKFGNRKIVRQKTRH